MARKRKDPAKDLTRSVQCCNVVAIRSLLNAGASVHERSSIGNLLHTAVKQLRTGLFLQDRSHESDESSRVITTQLVLEILLEYGAEVNEKDMDGNIPLHCVSHIKIAKTLLKYGASVHAKNKLEETPLHTIGWENRLVTKLLLNEGASPHTKDKDGNTPLHAAAKFASDPLIIECLINKGAMVNAKNHKGETPLHMAAEFSNSASVIEQLLAKGAVTNIQNKAEETPLTRLAKSNRRINLVLSGEIIKLLLVHGAYIDKPLRCPPGCELPYTKPLSDEDLLSSYWSPRRPFMEENKNFYTTLLLAGIKGRNHGVTENFKFTMSFIEKALKFWLNQRIFKKDSKQINCQTTPKILQALPRLLHFIKRLNSTNTPLLKAGYTLNELKPFLFISDHHDNMPLVERLNWFIFKGLSPNPLLVLEAIASKLLPVELVVMIRDHLANWAMINILISDYQLDNSVAVPLVFDVRENPKEYAAFHQRLFKHDWSLPFPNFDTTHNNILPVQSV